VTALPIALKADNCRKKRPDRAAYDGPRLWLISEPNDTLDVPDFRYTADGGNGKAHWVLPKQSGSLRVYTFEVAADAEAFEAALRLLGIDASITGTHPIRLHPLSSARPACQGWCVIHHANVAGALNGPTHYRLVSAHARVAAIAELYAITATNSAVRQPGTTTC
jgi:hypothetical protein